MRLDAFLKKTHLVKRRELARELCDEGMVRVNGAPKKAAWEVKAGDELQFPLYNRLLKVRVLALPETSAAKHDQWSFVEVLEEKRLTWEEGGSEEPNLIHPKSPTNH